MFRLFRRNIHNVLINKMKSQWFDVSKTRLFIKIQKVGQASTIGERDEAKSTYRLFRKDKPKRRLTSRNCYVIFNWYSLPYIPQNSF